MLHEHLWLTHTARNGEREREREREWEWEEWVAIYYAVLYTL